MCQKIHGSNMELQSSKVTVNDFMDVMMSDPGPHCLVWLPLLYRLGSVEQGKKIELILNQLVYFSSNSLRSRTSSWP